MNIVYDNIIFSIQKAGGISNYWLELLMRASSRFDQICILEYDNASSNNVFRSDWKPDGIRVENKGRIGKGQRYLPVNYPQTGEPTIFHSSYYRWPIKKKNAIVVTTLHDFIYEYHVSGLKKIIHSRQKKAALMRSDGIICISENTKKDLVRFYPECQTKKIAVIYNGVSDLFRPLSIADSSINKILGASPSRYAMFIGDRAPYKNFRLTVEAIASYIDLHLVLVGGKNMEKEEKKFVDKYLPNRVRWLRGIDNNTLNLLYNNAEFLIYPSSYEGFGMPVIEAMKAGCPVIALNRSSIAEVANGYPLLMSDASIDQILSKADYAARNRVEVINLGFKIAEKYSWDRCAEETFSFYQDLLDKVK